MKQDESAYAWIGTIRYCLAWIVGICLLLLIGICHEGTPIAHLFAMILVTALFTAADLVCGQLQNKGAG